MYLFHQLYAYYNSSPSTTCNNTVYPFELIVVFVFTVLALAIGGLEGFTLRLVQRLDNHMKTSMGIEETADYHPRGRKSDSTEESFLHFKGVEL